MPFIRPANRVSRPTDMVITVPTLPGTGASVDAELPPAGPLDIGQVELPVGRAAEVHRSYPRRVRPCPPALWVTDELIPDAAVAWRLLVDQFQTTGLWPLVLRPLYCDDRRPWDTGEFMPASAEDVAPIEVGGLLATAWHDSVVPIGGPSVHPAVERALSPFGWPFPGLAPALPRLGSPVAVPAAVLGPAAARIGLARCRRPADVVAVVGWSGSINRIQPPEVSAVLRSWEDRFGVVLAGLSFDVLTLLVPHPPQDQAQALVIAAELVAFCPDALWQGSYDSLRELSSALVDRPVWRLWFD